MADALAHVRRILEVFAFVRDDVEHALALRVGRGAPERADRGFLEQRERVVGVVVRAALDDVLDRK
jgi:hypothetical protein